MVDARERPNEWMVKRGVWECDDTIGHLDKRMGKSEGTGRRWASKRAGGGNELTPLGIKASGWAGQSVVDVQTKRVDDGAMDMRATRHQNERVGEEQGRGRAIG